MSVSRRSAMATAGAALALTQIAQVASAAEKPRGLGAAELYAISGEANAALMRGDIAQYTALVSLSEDFTLMSPFGGQPTRGSDYTPERMQAMGRFFRNGTFKQELVQSYASDDMVVLAVDRADKRRGRRIACPGLVPAGDPGLSAGRGRLAARAPSRRSPRARDIVGDGGSPRARRRGPDPA